MSSKKRTHQPNPRDPFPENWPLPPGADLYSGDLSELTRKVKKLQLPEIKYHIFLCCDQRKPKCCDLIDGLKAWEYLKKRLDELGLVRSGVVYRTKTDCLRICKQGPIAVVYPQGIWYSHCDEVGLERIIQEHFIQHRPVRDLMFFPNLADESD